MEHEPFWREREARFLALATPRLHGLRSDADVAELLADLSDHLLRALKAADAPTENVATLAQKVGHVAGLVLRQEYICQWNITGESNDTFACQVVIDRFRDEAALSARATDLVAVGLSNDEAVDRWVDALADPESPYWKRSVAPGFKATMTSVFMALHRQAPCVYRPSNTAVRFTRSLLIYDINVD